MQRYGVLIDKQLLRSLCSSAANNNFRKMLDELPRNDVSRHCNMSDSVIGGAPDTQSWPLSKAVIGPDRLLACGGSARWWPLLAKFAPAKPARQANKSGI